MEVRNQTADRRNKRLSRDDKELILVGVLVVAVAIPCSLVFCLKKDVSFDFFIELISEPSEIWIIIAALIALFIRETVLIARKINNICSGNSGAEDENADVTSPNAPISAVLENARAGVEDSGNGGNFKLSRVPSSDDLAGARDCLRENDLESAQNIYKRLLRSPESSGEAEIALRLISLYFASQKKDVEKMADEAEELLKSLSSNDTLHAEFIRAFAPWVSECVIPPRDFSLIFSAEATETQKRLGTFFRDAIIALIFSDRMSSLSEAEQRALRQSAVKLDNFSSRFLHVQRGSGYITVNRNRYTENELRMKEICAAVGAEDRRPVYKDDAEERQAKIKGYIVVSVFLAIAVAFFLMMVFV